MEAKYKTEASKWVAYGLNWIAREELELPLREPKRNTIRSGKLSKVEMLQVLGRDAKGLVDGLPLMHNTPTVKPIAKHRFWIVHIETKTRS